MYAFSATSRCIPLIIELGYLLSASRREWRQSGVKENGCVLCRNSSRSCKLPVPAAKLSDRERYLWSSTGTVYGRPVAVPVYDSIQKRPEFAHSPAGWDG